MTVVRLATKPQKHTHTTVDTLCITPALVKKWKSPPFQRPLRINDKVRVLAEQIAADGGVIPGVLTLGFLGGEEFLLDGQHRREAFLLSGAEEGYVDVRRQIFEDMGEMGEEFVNLNSALVRLRPDDILRGLEGTVEGLAIIRQKCPYVGYDMIRRNDRAPILSMSLVLRSWYGSAPEVPTSSGESAAKRAMGFTSDDAEQCARFLNLCYASWGRDPEYSRLWGGLNLILTAWLYRRTVITQYSSKSAKLTNELFGKCLMSVSATASYLEWLVGRNLSERDRSPAYSRIKTVFAKRYEAETGISHAKFPAPAWSAHSSSSRHP